MMELENESPFNLVFSSCYVGIPQSFVLEPHRRERIFKLKKLSFRTNDGIFAVASHPIFESQ